MILYLVWWILLRALTRVLADEKLLKTWDWEGNNGGISLYCVALSAFAERSRSRVPPTFSSRFSWFLRNRERFTTTLRRRRASFSSVRGGGERGLKRDAYTRFSRPPQRSVCFNSLCAESETTRTATDGWDERGFINHHLDCCCSFQTTLLRRHLHFRHFHPVFPLFPRLLLLFLSF